MIICYDRGWNVNIANIAAGNTTKTKITTKKLEQIHFVSALSGYMCVCMEGRGVIYSWTYFYNISIKKIMFNGLCFVSFLCCTLVRSQPSMSYKTHVGFCGAWRKVKGQRRVNKLWICICFHTSGPGTLLRACARTHPHWYLHTYSCTLRHIVCMMGEKKERMSIFKGFSM